MTRLIYSVGLLHWGIRWGVVSTSHLTFIILEQLQITDELSTSSLLSPFDSNTIDYSWSQTNRHSPQHRQTPKRI
jgi:hypothetical protein